MYTARKEGISWRVVLFSLCFFLSLVICRYDACAMTRSIGYPFEGRLENGIPFPNLFRGYQLRSEEHTYTTPEVIGALLDAIEGVKRDFPDTCDLYIGDFSKPGGGPWYPVHKSHQNGRDVDLGMYAKGNVPLTTLVPMSEENMDIPKTWSLLVHLLNSQMVEHVFVDASIQRILYQYALSQGYDETYLKRVFQVAAESNADYTVVKHEPNHRDHMHVRFVAPWSELAGRLEAPSSEERRVIELAQSSFLPKKVLYYAKEEGTPEVLATKLGISLDELSRWNKMQRLQVIRPGTPIVFYKRGFDVDGVRLAMSLDAPLLRSHKLPNLALLHDEVMLNIPSAAAMPAPSLSPPVLTSTSSPKSRPVPQHTVHTVKKGETIAAIARSYGISTKQLLAANNLSNAGSLPPGRKLLLPAGSSRGGEPQKTVAAPSVKKTTVAAKRVESSSKNSPPVATVGGKMATTARTVSSGKTSLKPSSKTSPTSAVKREGTNEGKKALSQPSSQHTTKTASAKLSSSTSSAPKGDVAKAKTVSSVTAAGKTVKKK